MKWKRKTKTKSLISHTSYYCHTLSLLIIQLNPQFHSNVLWLTNTNSKMFIGWQRDLLSSRLRTWFKVHGDFTLFVFFLLEFRLDVATEFHHVFFGMIKFHFRRLIEHQNGDRLYGHADTLFSSSCRIFSLLFFSLLTSHAH